MQTTSFGEGIRLVSRVGVLENFAQAQHSPIGTEEHRRMSVLSKALTPSEPADAGERRGTIRYQITVGAEVTEINSGTRFSTRTTDLGPGGCFVDTLMPLPVGSAVHLRLHKDKTSFESSGVVTFSQTGLGMGIAFDELPPQKLSELDIWLAELMSSNPAKVEARVTAEASPTKQPATANGKSDTTHRLIRLLVKRGVISEKDAESLESNPLL
jgi:hypothetical protein